MNKERERLSAMMNHLHTPKVNISFNFDNLFNFAVITYECDYVSLVNWLRKPLQDVRLRTQEEIVNWKVKALL